MTTSAGNRPDTHARHTVEGGGPPYSLNSALHLSRYVWAIDHLVRAGDVGVDLGCGTGFGVELLAAKCGRVVGVDLDPEVTALAPKLGLANAAFFCVDACSQDVTERIGVANADVVLSMETLEHLEDYFSYVENAIEMMAPSGTFVVGTPNRTMTYERYPGRRHMDPSHVQEFTRISLERTLRSYFESVEMFFQHVPGFWDKEPTPAPWASAGGRRPPRALRGWIPPNLAALGRRAQSRARRHSSSSAREADRAYALEDVAFLPAAGAPALSHDAFALVAVCRIPKS